MERWILSFFVGAILSLFSPIVPALFYKTLLLLIALMFLSFKSHRVVLSFAFGVLWVWHQADQLQGVWQSNQLDDNTVYQQTIDTKLSIRSIIDTNTDNPIQQSPARFYAELLSINGTKLNVPVTVRLTWKDALPIKQGNVLQLKLKLKPSHSLANIGSFDYKQWLLTKGVIATGYIKRDEGNRIVSKGLDTRQRLYDQYRILLGEHKLSPLILALTFGERHLFEQVHWTVLRKTGTQHLMAISGLHIGLVFALAFLLVRALLYVFPVQILNDRLKAQLMTLNVQPVLLVSSFLVALGYAYLANLSIPTLRALTMLAVFIFAKICCLHLSMTRLILLCLLFVVLFEPLSLLSPSFWLSFSAVVIIVLCVWRFSHLLNQNNRFCRYLLTLTVLQVGLILLMMPLNAMVFGQVSVVAIVANFIAVPVVSLLLMPILLLSMCSIVFNLPVTGWLVNIGLMLFEQLWLFLNYLASQTLSNVELTVTQQLLMIVVALLMLALLLKPIQIKSRLLIKVGVPMLFALSSLAFVKVEQDKWRLVVLDVGQGLSVLIVKNGRAILYDTGASYPSGFNLAEAAVLPYLASQNIEKIDYLFISHSDNDHAGGLNHLLAKFNVEIVVANETDHHELTTFSNKRKRNQNVELRVETCKSGQQWHWQNLAVSALHPTKVVGQDNDDSCVLHISDGNHSMLLTGDISRKIERKLAAQVQYGNVDIVVAPHHGSKTSSSKAFIDWAAPRYSVFSAGFMNRWHMPNAEVLSRYRQSGVETLNTAESGMVQFIFNNNHIEIVRYRTDIKPYWFAN